MGHLMTLTSFGMIVASVKIDLWWMINTTRALEENAVREKVIEKPEIVRKLLEQDMVHYRRGGAGYASSIKSSGAKYRQAIPILCGRQK
jgi:hypothetical protein